MPVGMERNDAALFAPPITICPPSNSFDNSVFDDSRDFAGLIFSRKELHAAIILANLCRLHLLPKSTVGCTCSTGCGSGDHGLPVGEASGARSVVRQSE